MGLQCEEVEGKRFLCLLFPCILCNSSHEGEHCQEMCNGGCEPGDYLNNSWGAQACCLRLSVCVDYIADELGKG